MVHLCDNIEQVICIQCTVVSFATFLLIWINMDTYMALRPIINVWDAVSTFVHLFVMFCPRTLFFEQRIG